MRKPTLFALTSATLLGLSLLANAQPAGGGPPSGSWREGPGWGRGMGMGPGGGMGHSPRRPFAMRGGLPDAYRSAVNPLPRAPETIERGAKVYADNCASCHGAAGEGDGAAARGLDPPPANLAWLAGTRVAQWDAYMLWTVSEGGAQFATAMPAFGDVLPRDDIWAVIAYIQAGLPGARK